MRILLTANASYGPPRGGATRSNLVWLDHMARHGHECRIVGGPSGEGAAYTPHPSLAIFPIADPAARIERLRREILDWRPDWVLVSSEDLSHALLREAHHSAPRRVVYLAHTPQFFPFGPESWNPDPAAAALVAQSAGIVAIGHHMAGCIERALHNVKPGCRATVIHPPIYGPGPWPGYANFDRGRIVMFNPCAVKGIGIFLDAARRMPHCEFGAVPGWGTTAEDRAALARLPNVRMLPNAPRIDDIFAGTRILMMPSLWHEGFGLTVMEAMLRGIPVVASDSGGLKEAKQGTNYVIPVHTIERYQAAFDQHAMPQPVLPENDIEPWVAALNQLLTDREAFQHESRASREAARRFVELLDAGAFEAYLTAQSFNPRHRLKILLAQNAVYHPAHGGGEKSNRLLMEALAARGHNCRVVARGSADLDLDRVHIRAAADNQLRATFVAEAAAFRPDVVLCSTDDPAQLLLEPALATGARVFYLVRATLPLPFGPDSAFPNQAQTARIRQADTVVGVSQYVADYVRRYAAIDAVHVPISLMPPEPYPGHWPDLPRFDNEFVAMVNPCAVKGIAIFLALADAFPEVRFAAVPTWGADAADRAALAARPNIAVLEPVEHIDALLARTRVLLVPSLWAEGRSRVVVEAMLRGVPVMAANTGGLAEAKMGVPYLLPVTPIAHYRPRLNERMVPVADVPAQDPAPWIEALRRLLTDRAHYEEVARQSRDAARRYAENLSVEPFEKLLDSPGAKPTSGAGVAPQSEAGPSPAHLSPEKRALLALRLRKRAPASAWFPTAAAAPPRLFYFPSAGEVGPPPFPSCAAVLPGRGPRIAEAPFERMAPLVQSLASAIEPYLAQPCAFFGHSLGAIVAFELARELRRRSLALPRMLIVSAARAPQFRRNHVPESEPSDEELLRQAGLPDDPAIRHSVLPALRADTRLYRHYIYTEEPPLPIPIRAYGGLDDPHISHAHLEAWREQTTESFALRQFPGGHFYLREHSADLEADWRANR